MVRFASQPKSSSPRRPKSSSSSAPARRSSNATMSHSQLSALAFDTKGKIKWNAILRGSGTSGNGNGNGDESSSSSSSSQWKWLENERNFSLYTKQNGTRGTAVLAIGNVKGSVAEVASLLTSFSQDEYVQKMEAYHESGFKHGVYIHDVDVNPHTIAEHESVHLSVRSATFARPSGWLSSHDEWCFLDATTMDTQSQKFEKLITTLAPQEVYSVATRKALGNGRRAKYIHNVIAGYRVEPDQYDNNGVPHGAEDTRGMQHDSNNAADGTSASATPPSRDSARVHFYAEHTASSLSDLFRARMGRLGASAKHGAASEKSIQKRLLQVAKSCDRLSHLVRRRRLGMQVLMDQKHYLLAPTKAKCFNCDTNLRLVVKVCRICGHHICSNCSAKYERETHSIKHATTRGRVRLESVRVCDPCLTRVDNANFAALTDNALTGQMVFPNPPGAKPPQVDLKDLLQDALLNAPSPTRRESVMSVIRCVLDQEREASSPATPSPLSTIMETQQQPQQQQKSRGIVLTPASFDHEDVDALDYLDVQSILYSDAELAAPEGRPYAIDSRAGDPAAQMVFPIPENELQRIDAIDKTMLLDAGTLEELNIICDIAAKELNSFASLISLITATEQKVIGANMPMLAEMVIQREDTFCQHTIMGDKPLVVPHPESDIRFSKIAPVTALGAQYYCGFPLVADDGHGTVIGSLCCIDNKKNALTESQYAVLLKLAQTASKVVRIQTQKRRDSAAAASALLRPSGAN